MILGVTCLAERRWRAAQRNRARAHGAAVDGSDDDDAGGPSGKPAGDEGGVLRKPIDEDESCPICYEDLTAEEESEGRLDWCRQGCGKSVHRHCLAIWAQHQASISKARPPISESGSEAAACGRDGWPLARSAGLLCRGRPGLSPRGPPSAGIATLCLHTAGAHVPLLPW